MKYNGFNFLTFSFSFALCLLDVSASAQMNRSAQANDITTNVYQNSTHNITGAALQAVLLNQNNSYVNLLSDTNLLGVRLFSPYAMYTPGMGVFYGDTLFKDSIAQHGSWNRNNWIKIGGGGGGVSGWSITGNLGTSPAINFIGTRDTATLVFKVDGIQAGIIDDSSVGNTYFGLEAGSLNPLNTCNGNAILNVGIGYEALQNNNVGGSQNIAIGAAAMQNNISGRDNIAIGAAIDYGTACHGTESRVQCSHGALGANITGNYNVAVGVGALQENINGNNNTATGYDAESSGVSGINNVAEGYWAGTLNQYGSSITTIGAQSGFKNKGSWNTFLGDSSGFNNTTGVDNFYGGYAAASSNQTGSSNTELGAYAGQNDGGSFNTFLGDSAGASNTTGIFNTVNGGYAFSSNISGSFNTAIGFAAMDNYTVGSNNTALGFNALQGSGANGSSSSTAVGFQAGSSNVADANTYIGDSSGFNNTTGSNNFYGGYAAASSNQTGNSNTELGAYAGLGNNASWNTFVGDSAGRNSNGGYGNTCLGYNATALFISGHASNNSIAIGDSATTVGNNAIAIGNKVTASNNQIVLGNLGITSTVFQGDLEPGVGNHGTSGQVLTSQGIGVAPQWTTISAGANYLTDTVGGSGSTPKLATQTNSWSINGNIGGPSTQFLGYGNGDTHLFFQMRLGGRTVGYADTIANTFWGYQAGYAGLINPTAIEHSTGIGLQALKNSTTGQSNTAVGAFTLEGNTSGEQNVAVGGAACMLHNFNYGTFVGHEAGYANSADFITGIGYQALKINTGANNTGLGTSCLQNNTSGGYNTAGGYSALSSNTTASFNTAYGANSMPVNTVGTYNAAFGIGSLYMNVSGSGLTADGSYTLLNNTGSFNTAIGDSALITNTSGTNNTALGAYANVGSNNLTNATAIGANSTVPSSNMVVLGNTSVTQLGFNGALEPYYSSAYQAGTSGQVLTSQGAGVAPQWVTATATNYLNDTVGGSGSAPQLVTKQVLRTDTLNSNNFIVGNAYMKSYVAQHSGGGGTNYLNDTVGGSGSKPNLATATNSWSTTGNSGINSSSNFIGTINNASLNFKVFNTVAGIVSVGGSGFGVCLGENTPTTAGEVTAFGTGALAYTNSATYYNTAFGYGAGQTNTNGSYNTLIGAYSNVSSNNLNNATALGYQATVTGSNALQLGNASLDSVNTYASININTPKTVVSASTSGTVIFTEPFGGGSLKKIEIYCSAAVGTASYTFPIAFQNTPGIIVSYNGTAITGAIVTSLSNTAVTITGSTSTGYITLEGW